MNICKHLKGEIAYNSDEELSSFQAILDFEQKRKKRMTMEELAALLITHEGFKFDLKIYE